MPWAEKCVPEPITDPPQFDEAKEGNQHKEEQRSERQNAVPSSTAQVRDAFVERFAMKPTDSGVFGNLDA